MGIQDRIHVMQSLADFTPEGLLPKASLELAFAGFSAGRGTAWGRSTRGIGLGCRNCAARRLTSDEQPAGGVLLPLSKLCKLSIAMGSAGLLLVER